MKGALYNCFIVDMKEINPKLLEIGLGLRTE